MAITKIEVERLSVTSSRPFENVVEAFKAAVGRPDMDHFAKATTGATTFAELQSAVQKGLGRTGLMTFMELDHGAILRKETGKDSPQILRFIIGNPLIMKAMASTYLTRVPTLPSRSWSTSDRMGCIYPTTAWRASSLLIEMPKPSLSPEISTRKSRASCENVPLDLFDAFRI